MPIDVRNLNQYGLFNLFWNTHGDPDLSGGGLNEVNTAGVQKLIEYAKKHNLDGTESRRPNIDANEKALIKAFLDGTAKVTKDGQIREIRDFIEQDAKVMLRDAFGLREEDIVHHDAEKPEKIGDITLPARVSRTSESQLANVDPRRLPQMFAEEYRRNVASFERQGTDAEKGAKVLGLLRDYAKALWARGETGQTEAIGNALLDAYETCRYANTIGAGTKNFNGAPWSVAQSLVLGLDPNNFPVDFPKAGTKGKTTYLDMSDEMAEPMGFVDKYLEKMGRPTGAKEYELNSPLGFMIGQPNGHNKAGSLSEAQPFSSSGLNWGLVMFRGSELTRIEKLKPKEGFEFKIDCLDGLGNFLRCDPRYGERLEVRGPNNRPVRVEQVIHEEGGKPASWSAKFFDGNTEIPADQVLGVFLDRSGRVKGDGKANNEVDMWWWGFCDRNTAQTLYKAKYGIPQLDVASVKVKAGRDTIEIPMAMAQKLVDADVPDLVTQETMCGFRFNAEPQQVSLKNGRSIIGRVPSEIMDHAPAAQRLGEDNIAVFNDARRPLLGTIDIKVDGHTETVSVRDIKSIEKDEQSGEVTIKLGREWNNELKGTLESEVSFRGAERRDGKLVINQDESFPVRGEIKVDTGGAVEKIPVNQINQIVGETANEMRISQFATWVSQNQGMYATDSSDHEVVSNGMRWTNKIETDIRRDESKPDWAREHQSFKGINGPLERQAGDAVVYIRGMFANRPGSEADSESFTGWVQINKNGRIINEGFLDEQPDFGWSALGPLNWSAKSSFNPHMDPELRLSIMVNGVSDLKTDTAKTEDLAKQLNLPANWKSYRTE